MPVFCKVHMTLCSYADAGKLSAKDNELTAKEKNNASFLHELPSFTEWFHYMNLSSTTWSGPMVEYPDYVAFMNYEKDSDIANMPKHGNWPMAWKRFLEVWLCAGVYVGLSLIVNPKYMSAPEFAAEPLYYRIYHLCMSM